MNQTLICEHGNHTWERPSQRGRKPRFCPEHRELSAPVEAVAAAPYAALIDRALDALDRLHDEDDVRKVDYILTQLSDGRRDPADEKHLAETLTHIIR